MTITTSISANHASPRRRPRRRFAQEHPEPTDRRTSPSRASAKASKFHPAGLIATQILAIQRIPQRATDTVAAVKSP